LEKLRLKGKENTKYPAKVDETPCVFSVATRHSRLHNSTKCSAACQTPESSRKRDTSVPSSSRREREKEAWRWCRYCQKRGGSVLSALGSRDKRRRGGLS